MPRRILMWHSIDAFLNSQNTDLWAPEVLQHEKYFSLIQEKRTGMFVKHLCRSLCSLKWREHLVVEVFPHLSKYFKHPIHDSNLVDCGCGSAYIKHALGNPSLRLMLMSEMPESKIWQPLSCFALPNYCLPLLTLLIKVPTESKKQEKGLLLGAWC